MSDVNLVWQHGTGHETEHLDRAPGGSHAGGHHRSDPCRREVRRDQGFQVSSVTHTPFHRCTNLNCITLITYYAWLSIGRHV